MNPRSNRSIVTFCFLVALTLAACAGIASLDSVVAGPDATSLGVSPLDLFRSISIDGISQADAGSPGAFRLVRVSPL